MFVYNGIITSMLVLLFLFIFPMKGLGDICAADKYGVNCEQDCPVQCKQSKSVNRVCDVVNGTCLGSCKVRFYGEHCDKNCSDLCKRCEGTATRCSQCSDGNFGKKCNKTCSSGCKDKCDRSSGECRSCNSGLFGHFCENNCSLHCIEASCDRRTGACRGGCQKGWFGTACENSCGAVLPNCLHCTNLGQLLGTVRCIECKPHLFGITCSEECPDTCMQCMNDTFCTKCVDGRYGNTCQYTNSSKTCFWKNTTLEGAVLVCQNATGTFTRCSEGYHGPDCTKRCSTSCKSSTEGRDGQSRVCERSSGKCLYGCQSGWFGETCGNTCRRDCLNNVCNQSNGECVYGCRDAQNGGKCSNQYNANETTSSDGTRSVQNENWILLAASPVSAACIVGVVIVVIIVVWRRSKSKHASTIKLLMDKRYTFQIPENEAVGNNQQETMAEHLWKTGATASSVDGRVSRVYANLSQECHSQTSTVAWQSQDGAGQTQVTSGSIYANTQLQFMEI